jgi:D-alanine transaminase
VQITRGTAPRKHDWEPDQLRPTVVVRLTHARPLEPDLRAQGAACVTCTDQRWGRCDIKSLNLLANVLAKQCAHDAGAYEAILVDSAGTVTEGASHSVIMVRGGALLKHPDGPRILPGITQEVLWELAAELGVPTEERTFSLAELLSADEVFLTATTAEVLGVVSVDGQCIGDGRVGSLTRRLEAAFAERMERETTS